MKLTGWMIVVFAIVISLCLFVLSKSNPVLVFTANPYLSLAQSTGIVGAVLLSIAFVLSSRTAFVESLFGGMDKAYKAHHWVSAASYLLLLNHFAFLIVSRMPVRTAVMALVLPNDVTYIFGTLGLVGLTVLIVLTLYVTLPYDIWKKTPEWMGLPLLLGSVHAFLIASDIAWYQPLRWYVLGWLLIAIAAYVYRRFLYRYMGVVRPYAVSSINRTGDILELTLSPVKERMDFVPGQFAYIAPEGGESHPFSMTSSPDDTEIKFAIRIVGDGTLSLRDTKIGSPFSVEGPYGRFAERFLDDSRDAICVAGGIGITPFSSMMAKLSETKNNRKVILIHSVRNESEAIFGNKLRSVQARNPAFMYRLNVTAKEGRLTRETIRTILSGTKKPVIYLCGPKQMMDSMRNLFLEEHVPLRNIVSEDFSVL